MGVAERQEREKEARRLAIIRAAERVFVRRGLEAATMDDIAAEAEFTKRTVYSYFASKEDLQSAVVLLHLRKLVEWFSAASGEGTGLEQVRRLGNAWVRFSREEPEGFQLMANCKLGMEKAGAPPNQSEVARLSRTVFELVVAAFVQGLADGSVRAGVDPGAAALFVISASSGVLAMAVANGEAFGHGLPQRREDFISLSMDLIGDAFRP